MADTIDSTRLRSALESAGVSGAELADVLGVTRGFVSQWLTGHRACPRKYIRPIGEYLQVDRGWLVGRDELGNVSHSDQEDEMPEGKHDPVKDGEWSFREAPEDGGRDYGSANIWTLPANLATLVRETGQNSLDHAVKQGGEVQMRFGLIELTRGSREYQAFMEACHFGKLRDHLQEAAATKSKLSTRLRAGLKRLEASGRLRLLRIDDFGTTGLFGGEMTSGRNENNPFASLIRNNLDSSKQSTTAGGSFGLGKAVLWRCSELSTVLFSSDISPAFRGDEMPAGRRLIGKAELTWHQMDGRSGAFAGPGWLGLEGTSGRSLWAGDQALKQLQLDRATDLPPGVDPARAFGTSVLIVGFQDPAAAGEPDAAEILESISRAAAESFWPLMVRDRFHVSVEHRVDGDLKERVREIDPSDYVIELCDALIRHDSDEVDDELIHPKDVVRVSVPHLVPATEDETGELREFSRRLEARADLVVRLADPVDVEEKSSNQLNTLALVRGRGMVVKYWPRRNLVVGARPFHAVLLTGRMAGSDAPQVAADQFLRLSEPPAHDEWEFNSEVKEKYEWGAGRRLAELFEAVSEALAELLQPRSRARDEPPSELQRLLQIASSKPSPPPTATLRRIEPTVENGRWRISAEIHMNDRKRRWAVTPRLRVDAESGKKLRVPWMSLEILDVGRGSAVYKEGAILVEPGTRRIRFRAQSLDETDGVHVADCRTQLDLQVKEVAESEVE